MTNESDRERERQNMAGFKLSFFKLSDPVLRIFLCAMFLLFDGF